MDARMITVQTMNDYEAWTPFVHLPQEWYVSVPVAVEVSGLSCSLYLPEIFVTLFCRPFEEPGEYSIASITDAVASICITVRGILQEFVKSIVRCATYWKINFRPFKNFQPLTLSQRLRL